MIWAQGKVTGGGGEGSFFKEKKKRRKEKGKSIFFPHFVKPLGKIVYFRHDGRKRTLNVPLGPFVT